MNRPTKRPNSIATAQTLFFVNAAIWLMFGAISLTRMASNPDPAIAVLMIGVLMLGNVGALLIAGIGLGRQSRWFYYFGIVVLLINIILTITDEFGVFDLITLLLDVLLLGILIATRSHYGPGKDRSLSAG